MSNVENLSPQTIRQLIKEMHDIATNSPEGIKVQINDADVTDIQAILQGPGRIYKFLLMYVYLTFSIILNSWNSLCRRRFSC